VRSLITGVGGFAGQHLASWLLDRGDEVFGVARGEVDWHLADLTAAQGFNLLAAGLTEYAGVTRAVEAAAPDRIFHLAARSSVAQSFADPVGILQNNVAGLVNVLEAARSLMPKTRTLVVSSSEVYGRASWEAPIDEQAELRPENPYAVSKAAGDLFAYQYHAAYELDIVRLRPFTHIGPGQSDRFAASSFARQIAEIERGLRPPVIEVGNLDAMRDITDVRDMVRAYELAALRAESGAVYNIGRGSAVPIRTLLENLIHRSQASIDIQVRPDRLREVDAPLQVCDASGFRARTGWEARIPLEQTLNDMLDYWRARVTAV
jgi:GDP-4-dehydro-6-deoxy-D-mannose reductase